MVPMAIRMEEPNLRLRPCPKSGTMLRTAAKRQPRNIKKSSPESIHKPRCKISVNTPRLVASTIVSTKSRA